MSFLRRSVSLSFSPSVLEGGILEKLSARSLLHPFSILSECPVCSQSSNAFSARSGDVNSESSGLLNSLYKVPARTCRAPGVRLIPLYFSATCLISSNRAHPPWADFVPSYSLRVAIGLLIRRGSPRSANRIQRSVSRA